MSSFWDYVTSSALSLTVSGNTGISPFLTLLLLGIVEISDPSLLNMGETMETILASWYSIAILGVLTLLEIIGKCIPAVDEIIDSVEVFVVPVLSIFGTLGTVGVLDLVATAASNGMMDDNGDAVPMDVDESQRMLGDAGDSFLTAWKVILVVWGIFLALLIHFFKMIIRISGLVCCMGCCQPCITVLEITIVCCGVVFAIFIRQIAVVICIIFLLAAAYTIKVKCCTKEEEEEGQNDNKTNTGINQPSLPTVEQPSQQKVDEKGDNAGASPPSAAIDVENPPSYALSSFNRDETNHVTNKYDTENSSPTASATIVSVTEVTPIPPPPATNPNYIDAETPVAIAVPISDDNSRSTPNTVKNASQTKENNTSKRKAKSSQKEDDQKKKGSAVVY